MSLGVMSLGVMSGHRSQDIWIWNSQFYAIELPYFRTLLYSNSSSSSTDVFLQFGDLDGGLVRPLTLLLELLLQLLDPLVLGLQLHLVLLDHQPQTLHAVAQRDDLTLQLARLPSTRMCVCVCIQGSSVQELRLYPRSKRQLIPHSFYTLLPAVLALETGTTEF